MDAIEFGTLVCPTESVSQSDLIPPIFIFVYLFLLFFYKNLTAGICILILLNPADVMLKERQMTRTASKAITPNDIDCYENQHNSQNEEL